MTNQCVYLRGDISNLIRNLLKFKIISPGDAELNQQDGSFYNNPKIIFT